jgi:hypothetical protein
VTQTDVLAPLQVVVSFPDFPRRSPRFIGLNPVDLIDYRTIPILIVEGNNVASVSSSPRFIGLNPVDLIDYRTIPILIVEGNNACCISK